VIPLATYTLCHNDNVLLTLEACTTPPFSLGEVLCLHDADTGEQRGPFVVERLARQILYRTKQTEPEVCVPLAGQVVQVEVREAGKRE
jgi:hypothetical protein